MYISVSVKNTQKISRNNEIQALSFMQCQTLTNIFLKKWLSKIKEYIRIDKEIIKTDQKINLFVDEYDGETLSHDKLMKKHVKFILYQI